MSKFRPWAFWRRVQYGSGFLLVWALVVGAVYYSSQATPTCFDGVQNAKEQGVDCGGACLQICAHQVMPPTVAWVESFKIQDGQYNVVAYVENRNLSAATPELRYRFKLLNQGTLIAEQTGKTVLPPNTVLPIFAGRVSTDNNQVPTETVIELEPVTLWLPATAVGSQFRTLNTNLLNADTRPRLEVNIENTELTPASNVEVVATIFDSQGKPVTASQTLIDSIGARSAQLINFTWPNSIAKTVRSCEIPSDIMLVLDRSGSMASEGGDPPQPLQNAKQAAEQFIKQTKTQDQIGLLSYATAPSNPLEQTLTSDKLGAITALANVVMGQDGIQYTNMGDAFAVAQAELMSERHRPEARKVIIFLTDGDVTRPVNPETGLADRDYAASYAIAAADRAKAQDTTIYTIGFGNFFATSSEAVTRDIDLIRNLASAPQNFFEAPTIADLNRVYNEIATGICEDGPARIEVIAKPKVTFPAFPGLVP